LAVITKKHNRFTNNQQNINITGWLQTEMLLTYLLYKIFAIFAITDDIYPKKITINDPVFQLWLKRNDLKILKT
jgi:hypothetical protein